MSYDEIMRINGPMHYPHGTRYEVCADGICSSNLSAARVILRVIDKLDVPTSMRLAIERTIVEETRS